MYLRDERSISIKRERREEIWGLEKLGGGWAKRRIQSYPPNFYSGSYSMRRILQNEPQEVCRLCPFIARNALGWSLNCPFWDHYWSPRGQESWGSLSSEGDLLLFGFFNDGRWWWARTRRRSGAHSILLERERNIAKIVSSIFRNSRFYYPGVFEIVLCLIVKYRILFILWKKMRC